MAAGFCINGISPPLFIGLQNIFFVRSSFIFSLCYLNICILAVFFGQDALPLSLPGINI